MDESLREQARRLKSDLNLTRSDGRKPDEPRPFALVPGFTQYAEGSILATSGNTKVICTASVEDKVPAFLRGAGRGWVTAEYGMLPRATSSRTTREASTGRPSGRTAEIQRLIGRALRSAGDMKRLGERTFTVDRDVIQADGGTRTAAITGAYAALVLALRKLAATQRFQRPPVSGYVAAVSVGLRDGVALLDLNYEEVVAASVDLNAVMTDALEVDEVARTPEGQPFSLARLRASRAP